MSKLCNCRRSDAWRCAVDSGSNRVSCACVCHQRINYTTPPTPFPGAQYELALDDWRYLTLEIAWHPLYHEIEGDDGKEIHVMHFAQDLSGGDQPPFSGWFYEVGKGSRRFFTAFYPHYWRLIV